MKFTLNWLKEFLDTDKPLDELTEVMTSIGLEVEEIIDHSEALKPFIVAEILEANPHPDADKLQVCNVANGDETLQIVCGAPNARAGIKVVLAEVGTVIPTNDMKIKQAKIRGVESNGMLCSARELGIGDDHDGIMELPATATIGEPFAPQLGLDDPMIEIAITPDRQDCLGVYGIARDLSAAGMGTLKPLSIPTVKGRGASAVKVDLVKEGNDHACAMFVGCTIKGVNNGPSPDWLQQRLKAIGLRPISALVDITNYLTFTYGRPSHVYDVSKLTGDIHVRRSRKGEKLDALNDKSYVLDDSVTVIADDAGVLGMGGIIGGVPSGCTDETTEVFLEVAYFDPIEIAQAGRKFSIESDARYRFERGVDPAFLVDGAALATQMILDLCGGEASELIIAGAETNWQHTIDFDPQKVEAMSGVAVTEDQSRTVLTNLGFDVTKNWQVAVPSWRPDVQWPADLVEEVLRIIGFDTIPDVPLPIPEETPDVLLPLEMRQASTARHALAARGMLEVHSWSFLHHETAELFGGQAPSMKLLNPISSELDTMRPNLLPNLLAMTKRNQERGFDMVSLCEVGLTFAEQDTQGQQLVAAGLRAGELIAASPHAKAREVDVFDAKADALHALEACGAPVKNLQTTRDVPSYYHPGQAGTLQLGKNILGFFGSLHPKVLEAMGVKGPVVGFELFLDAIPQAKQKPTKVRPAYRVSDLQPVDRDFSFILDQDVLSSALMKAIAGADKKHIQGVTIVSTYQGKEEKARGEVAIALRVHLQPLEKTLTEEDIDAISKKILLAALKVNGCSLSEALKQYAKEKKLELP
jgi:phenylalanyl-tRNA synthetase beta chain